MQQIKTPTALRQRKAMARYLRAAILAQPDLVHQLAAPPGSQAPIPAKYSKQRIYKQIL